MTGMRVPGGTYVTPTAPAPRRRNAQPEHALQTACLKFSREAITVAHLFLGFDRSKKQSEFQHIFEAARGIKAGTPDCMVMALGCDDVWVELKVGSNEADDDQIRIGGLIMAAGRLWGVGWSVEDFRTLLLQGRVPMVRHSADLAAYHDRTLALAFPPKKSSAPKKPRTAKPRKPRARPTPAGLRFGRRVAAMLP